MKLNLCIAALCCCIAHAIAMNTHEKINERSTVLLNHIAQKNNIMLNNTIFIEHNKVAGEENGLYTFDYNEEDTRQITLENLQNKNLASLSALVDIVGILKNSTQKAFDVILNCITKDTLGNGYKMHVITIITLLLKTDKEKTLSHVLSLINKNNIDDYWVCYDLIPLLLMHDYTNTVAHIISLLDANNITTWPIYCSFMPHIIQHASQDIMTAVLKLINEKNINYIRNYGFEHMISLLIQKEPAQVSAHIHKIIESMSLDDIAIFIAKLIQIDPSITSVLVKKITPENFDSLSLSTYQLLVNNDIDKKNITMLTQTIGDHLNTTKNLQASLFDIYLLNPEKSSDYIIKQYFKHSLAGLLGTKQLRQNIQLTPSEQLFNIIPNTIIKRFSHYNKSDITKRISIKTINNQEKKIIKSGNYPIAHGRSSLKFVTDNVFMYLQDIFYLSVNKDGKEIDKTCHYTQHYAFPNETWEKAPVYFYEFWKNSEQDPFSQFIGLPINLPKERVTEILKHGVTSDNNFSYERSCLMFGSNILGIKGGSSAIIYVLKNNNANIKRGIINVEDLFKKLGNVLNKDVMSYYKKYKHAFDLICKAAEMFEHGTMLIYEFTPKALQKYVTVTHSSGGHIDNEESGIKINGKRTTDPKLVLDTLLHNPEQFDEPERDYEYFWPLTDEGTAHPFNDNIKTYAFNIGKHDEELAKNIKHWIAKLFERIKLDMANDGIIEYHIKTAKL